jgi:hypothetical protein
MNWALVERCEELTRQNPARAKVEIVKHLDGDLVIAPRPAGAAARRAEVSERVKPNGLPGAQEAVCRQVVAGARNHLPANRSLAFRFQVTA